MLSYICIMKKLIINTSSDSLNTWERLSEKYGVGYIYQCNYKWIGEVSFYHTTGEIELDNVVAIFKVRRKA